MLMQHRKIKASKIKKKEVILLDFVQEEEAG